MLSCTVLVPFLLMKRCSTSSFIASTIKAHTQCAYTHLSIFSCRLSGFAVKYGVISLCICFPYRALTFSVLLQNYCSCAKRGMPLLCYNSVVLIIILQGDAFIIMFNLQLFRVCTVLLQLGTEALKRGEKNCEHENTPLHGNLQKLASIELCHL